MKISKEVKIGFVFLVGLLVLFLGLNFLKGYDIFNSKRTFICVYKNVNGLVASNPVTLNGIKIGQVTSVSFDSGDPNRIIVELTIDNEDINIPSNSVAHLTSDIMGSKSINFMLGNSSVFAENGDTINSSIQTSLQDEVNEQLKPLKMKTENMISSIDTLLTTIQLILNQGMRDNLEKSFNNINLTIRNLQSTTYSIDTLVTSQRSRLERILVNVESIIFNVKNSNEQVKSILQNFASISDSIAKADITHTLKQTDAALTNFNEITTKINKGEGSIGLLVNNDSLYYNLESAAKNLDLLMIDLKERPSRYVHFSIFGKKNK